LQWGIAAPLPEIVVWPSRRPLLSFNEGDPMSEQPLKKRGFAAITPERMKEIASAGGIARKRAFDLAHGSRTKPHPSLRENQQPQQTIHG
jgi:hypothetical protein